MKLAMALTCLLVGICIHFATLSYKTSSAIDFYEYWGVGMAKKLSGGTLSSPYVDIEGYDELLTTYAGTSGDMRLRLANENNRGMYNKYSLELNATPLLYTLYSLMPSDFSLSYGIFLGLRVVLFLSALYLLCPDRKLNLVMVISGFFCVFFYEPLGSDARVGNLNTLQFFVVAATAYYIEFFLKKRTGQDLLLQNAAVLGGIVFMVLLKPNFFLIALALTVSLAANQGVKMFSKAAAAAGMLGVALFVIPCLYFNTWMVWSDWFGYLSHKISSYSIQDGNFATFLFVSKMFNLSGNVSKLILTAILVASGVWALMRSAEFNKTVIRIMYNPYLAVAVAVSATMALSPLIWFHYYVMLLLPALWMITVRSSPAICRAMGMLAFFLSSGFMSRIIGVNDHLWYFFASSWVPLWAGVLVLTSRGGITEDIGQIPSLPSAHESFQK